MDNLAGSGEESQKYERTIPKVFSSSLKLIKSHLFPLLIRIRAALDPLVQCAPPLTCFTNLTMTNLQILLPFTLIGTKDNTNTWPWFSSTMHLALSPWQMWRRSDQDISDWLYWHLTNVTGHCHTDRFQSFCTIIITITILCSLLSRYHWGNHPAGLSRKAWLYAN